jgi:pyrroloquinoline quinone biosynthesis protein D
VIPVDARPTLASKVRLRWDRRAEKYMLLYPERGLVLNATDADIVQLCTGEHTVGGIVTQLAGKYAREPEDVAQEVQTFLTRLAERGLIRSGDE